MRTTILALSLALGLSGAADAAAPRPIGQIDSEVLVDETQPTVVTGSDNTAFIWWMPKEFWHVVIAAEGAPDNDTKAMLKELDKVSIVCVAQADMTAPGVFSFYGKDEVAKQLQIAVTRESGETVALEPLKKNPTIVDILLGAMQPALAGAAGNFGQNMHFFVVEDVADKDKRVIDPYRPGKLTVQLGMRDKSTVKGEIEFPLNSLFTPRLCPNGKPAHVTWNFCPWGGERLKD